MFSSLETDFWQIGRDSIRVWDLVRPLLVLVVSLSVLLLIRQVMLRRLSWHAEHRQLASASQFLETLRFPSLLWCFAGTLILVLRFVNLRPSQIDFAGDWIEAFLIISVSLVLAAGLVRTLSVYGQRRNLSFANAGLTQTLIYVLILSLGFAITMQMVFKRPVSGLLTALGIGGLAVALALQDTLANLFAGVHILLENPIAVGDFIRLSTGEEGMVSDIGWRTTRLKTGSNNTIVIPNTKITTAILTNYTLPDRRTGVEVLIYAGMDADPARIEAIALEEAAQTPLVLPDPAPAFAMDPGIVPYYLQCKVVVFVENRLQQGPVQSALRMKLIRRFQAEGIPLPKASAGA